jgi:hypothetical protein
MYVTWMQDADTAAAAPEIPQGASPQYNITVRNTGDVTLSNVAVSDPSLPTFNGAVGTLAAGASRTITVTGTWRAGQVTNTASVSGFYSGTTVTSSDVAIYRGVVPSIDVKKAVRDASGTWQVRVQLQARPQCPCTHEGELRCNVTSAVRCLQHAFACSLAADSWRPPSLNMQICILTPHKSTKPL